MNPGSTAWPVQSTASSPSRPGPTSTILPSATTTSATSGAAPVPSNTEPPRNTTRTIARPYADVVGEEVGRARAGDRWSAHGAAHELGDPLLVSLGELDEGERRRPHRAVVEVGDVVEAERGVAGLELVGALEEAHDLADLGVGRHAVPGLRSERRRMLGDDGVDALGQVTVVARH